MQALFPLHRTLDVSGCLFVSRISGNIWPDCQIVMKLGGRVEQGNLMRQMVCKTEPSGEPSLEEEF